MPLISTIGKKNHKPRSLMNLKKKKLVDETPSANFNFAVGKARRYIFVCNKLIQSSFE